MVSLGLKTLKQSGILDSYQYLLSSLCKYGLPTGDLYEFSALTVLRYEKKVKQQRKGELAVRMKERSDQKDLAKGKQSKLAIGYEQSVTPEPLPVLQPEVKKEENKGQTANNVKPKE